MFLLELNNQRILLECGMYQGKRKESIERNRKFPFDPQSIDVAVLSHSHIDHCGNFPNLCRNGFDGNIFCTHATRDLAGIMLEDSARIQESDAEYISRKNEKKGLPPVEPLYTVRDADKASRQFVSTNYDRPMLIADGVTLTFHDAGHILGSAQIALDIRENGRNYRYLFTGDIGRSGHAILRNPDSVKDVDYLQIESTYGNREHGPRADAPVEICKLVRETAHRGGKIIIPAFSVGRTQLIVYTLHQLAESGDLPPIPIFVDSPLSVNATEVFRLHPECFNEEIYTFLREKENPFGMENLKYIRNVSQSKQLNLLNEPAIIISSSGMCEGGRIRHHLKNNIENPKNLVLFVGYCAQHTLGARIINGDSPVKIFGEEYEIKAQVARLDAYSGHADKHELQAHVDELTGDIQKAFVVHGEEDQSLAFADTLREQLPNAEVRVPVYGEKITI
ncbi:MAG: MBL fold metallo-hydrolase [Verrucomicrobiales bacterium]|nr:MBL fold metallo-hydrolase [Verrucomicrobiales bacterium]|tara:strand:- start:15531 stop:16880 length:1350 start_codon:yes stop_codon:yes gene_type:complete